MIEKTAPYVTFLIIHISLVFFIYPEKIFEATDRAHWQPVVAGCLLEFTMLWLYLKALVVFPHADIMDMMNSVVPKWVTRLVLLPLVIYFFANIILHIRSHSEVLTIVLTPHIPIWALMLFLVISLFSALSDIQSVLRACFVTAFIFVPIVCFCVLSSLQNTKLQNIMPLGNAHPDFFYQAPFYSGFFTFSSFLFLGIIRPYIQLEAKAQKYYLLLYAGLLFPLTLASIYVPLLVFGQETASKYLFPFIEAMDTINLFWLMFERVTIFYVTATLSFIIMYTALLIWMTAMMLHKLYFGFSRKGWSVLVTLASYIAACFIPNWTTIEELIWLDTGLRFYCIAGLPVILSIIGLVYKRRRAVT